MRLRVCVMLVVLVVLSSLSVYAAGHVVRTVHPAAAVAKTVPAYSGTRVEFEMTLTDKDFLPAIKQFLPGLPAMVKGVPGQAGAMVEACKGVDFDKLTKQLASAISGLKLVSVVGYQAATPAVSAKIDQYYTQKLGLATDWTPTLIVNEPQGTVHLYTKPDLAGIFAIVLAQKQVFVVRTEGKIDIAQIAKLAAEYAPMMIQAADTPQGQPNPPAAVQPSPAPAPAPQPPANAQ